MALTPPAETSTHINAMIALSMALPITIACGVARLRGWRWQRATPSSGR